ncbi:MAG: hypothetical protein JSW08_01775 [archaeon]|nr:MAG: hypothetical protein JSW08_01775 [archaeon]
MKKKVAFFLVLIILILMFFINGCGLPEETVLEFSSEGCDRPPINYTSEGIKSTVWFGNNIVITAYAMINCAETVLDGDYEINGTRMTLIYKTSGCDPCTTCVCPVLLIYGFKYINYQDFIFELKQVYA